MIIKDARYLSQLKCALNLYLIYIDQKSTIYALNIVLWCLCCSFNSSPKAFLKVHLFIATGTSDTLKKKNLKKIDKQKSYV